jgi:putative lipoprotein
MNPASFVLCLCLSFATGQPPRDPWVSEDKLMHFAASFAATTLAASAARTAGLDPERSTVAGAVAAAGIGVWKEVDDHRRPGGFFSFRDLLWDAAGIGAAAGVMRQVR